MGKRQNIYVTKTSLPPLEKYISYLKTIWKNNQVTNHGPLASLLEKELKDYLGVRYLHFVSNGTVAMEVAIKAMDLSGGIITTPFSYVATTSAIMWTSCKPVYVDIDENTLCIDPLKIEKAITKKTGAILATHVYGNTCDIEKIDKIAKKYKLKVIYDAAHAFGVKYNGRSVLECGDVSTISFHATKLFHTAEGGAVITRDPKLSKRLFLAKAFGHLLDDHLTLGINGKNSELHAAMGLCNLSAVNKIIEGRKKVFFTYIDQLKNTGIKYPVWNKGTTRNYGYFPVIFPSAKKMQSVKKSLESGGIYPRRYFYPSLNRLPYMKGASCPVSESIAGRILCLPLYDKLKTSEVKSICKLIKNLVS